MTRPNHQVHPPRESSTPRPSRPPLPCFFTLQIGNGLTSGTWRLLPQNDTPDTLPVHTTHGAAPRSTRTVSRRLPTPPRRVPPGRRGRAPTRTGHP